MSNSLKNFIIFWLIILGIVGLVGLLYIKQKHKNTHNQTCKTTQDCISGYTCYKNICCKPNCDNKTCSEHDGCGNLCGCDIGKKCVNGSCCSEQCDGISCGPGTKQCDGSPCGCNSGQTCDTNTHQCCTPKSCKNNYCGYRGCGLADCPCIERLGICINNTCDYNNVCSIKNSFDKLLFDKWGGFCSECSNCSLQNVVPDGKSIIPLSGTVVCEKCRKKDGTWNTNVTPVEIDSQVYNYGVNNYGQIVSKTIDPKGYCKTNGCSGCYCKFDDDCKRWGCSECIGQTCV